MKSTQTLRSLRSQRAFTLTELAIVLVIVAFLIGGMLLPLSTQRDIQATNETQKALSEMKESLLGFAAANGRLPCPDTDFDGIENTTSAPSTEDNKPSLGQSTQIISVCTSSEGDFPFATVGTPRVDSWGNRFRYRVDPLLFARNSIVWSGLNATGTTISTVPFSLGTTGNIIIQTRGDDPSTTAAVETKFISNLATNIPAVIISHGKNGYGARTSEGTQLPAPQAANTDETTNANTASAVKISRFSTPAATPCSDTSEGVAYCEFDDVVDWLSPNILKNRMIAAGRLPY